MDAFDAWPCLHCTDHVPKVRPVHISHIGRSALICIGYVLIRTAMRKLPTARMEVTKVYCNCKKMDLSVDLCHHWTAQHLQGVTCCCNSAEEQRTGGPAEMHSSAKSLEAPCTNS